MSRKETKAATSRRDICLQIRFDPTRVDQGAIEQRVYQAISDFQEECNLSAYDVKLHDVLPAGEWFDSGVEHG